MLAQVLPLDVVRQTLIHQRARRQLRHSWPPCVMTAEDMSHLRNGHAPIVHRYEYLTQLFTALTHLFARNRLFKGFFEKSTSILCWHVFCARLWVNFEFGRSFVSRKTFLTQPFKLK